MPVAGDLQVYVHKFSTVVRAVDTSNGKLAINLIAKGENQRRVPRKHPPDPRLFKLNRRFWPKSSCFTTTKKGQQHTKTSQITLQNDLGMRPSNSIMAMQRQDGDRQTHEAAIDSAPEGCRSAPTAIPLSFRSSTFTHW